MRALNTIAKMALAACACFVIFLTNASAGQAGNHCDVVSINGTGRLQADGRIIGNETISVAGKSGATSVKFVAVTLGIIHVDQTTGAANLATSHNFSSVNNHAIDFTTFDELTVIPLNGADATCTQNVCGLVFKLKLEKGIGRYSCGEIVSGYNTDSAALIPFTSYVDPFNPATNGDTVVLHSMGKLCQCGD